MTMMAAAFGDVRTLPKTHTELFVIMIYFTVGIALWGGIFVLLTGYITDTFVKKCQTFLRWTALHYSDVMTSKLDHMTRSMDTTADPCNDFFTYAAGNFDLNQIVKINLFLKKSLPQSDVGDQILTVQEVKAFFSYCLTNTAIMEEPIRPEKYNLQVTSWKLNNFTFPMKNEVIANNDDFFIELVLEMYVCLFYSGAPIFNQWGSDASAGKLFLNIPPKVNQEQAWQKYCNVTGGCANLVYDRNYMAQGYVQADHLKGRFFNKTMGTRLDETFPDIAFYFPNVIDPSQSAHRANFLNHLMEYFTDQIHRPKKFYNCEDYIQEAFPLQFSKMAYEFEVKQDKAGFEKLKAKFFEEGNAIKKTAEGMLRNANFKQNQTRQNYLDRLAKNEFKFVDHPILLGDELASVELLYWDAPYMRRFVNGIAKVFKFNSEKKLKNFVIPEYKFGASHSRENQHNYFHFRTVEYPYYDIDFPASLDFSGTGFVMAHELAHTFGDNLLQSHEDPDKEHRARWDCITKLYSQQCDPQRPDFCVNPNKIADEAFADQVGIRLAYFSNFVPGNISEPRIIQQFSNRQLFFINMAQTIAATGRWKDYNVANPHPPARVRVWGALANFKGFAEAFRCPVGSRYHLPADQRCNIFDFDIDSTTTTTTTATTTTTTATTTTATTTTTTTTLITTTAATTTIPTTTAVATEITTPAATTTTPTTIEATAATTTETITTTIPATTATTTETTEEATTTITTENATTSTAAHHEPVVTEGTHHASTNTPPAPGPTKSTPNPHTTTTQSTPRTTPSTPRTTPPMPRTTPSGTKTTPSTPRTTPSTPRTTPSKPRTTPTPSSPEPDYNHEEYGEVVPKNSILLSPPSVLYPILAFAYIMFQ
ncbi:unnamed protein product [Bursaphelenchus xylophilus]|nr:unnamed protein product [Bursaphelenchus xylophilus]CAG9116929.1 unnamed protein product [Bursaphelenchus xylophilus]